MMKKTAMLMVLAGVLTACNGPTPNPGPDPDKQPDNSYIYNGTETAIRWVGVRTSDAGGSDAIATLHLAANVPADPSDNLNDITAEVNIAIPVSRLGEEKNILEGCVFSFFDHNEGFNFSNNNIASGTVTAFVSGANVNVVLVVEFTNGKKLALKYVGTATILENGGTVDPPLPPGRDLNKEYLYNGDTTKIVWTGVGEYKIPVDGVVDYKISINSSIPADQEKPDVGSTGFIYMYIPQNKTGQTIDLSVKSAVTDGWWIYFNDKKSGKTYLGDQVGTTRKDIVSGTLKVEYYPEEYNWRMVYSLDCTFTDGKTLQVRYEGGTHPLPTNVVTPPPPDPGDGTGTVTFDAGTPYNIGWTGVLYNATKKSYSMALIDKEAKKYGSVWQLMDNAVMINVPEELLGVEIDLSVTHTVTGRDIWGFAYNDYDSRDINFEGYEDPTVHASYGIGGNIASGTMKVTKVGDIFTITFNVQTKTNNTKPLWNNHTVSGSYTGTLTDMTSWGAKIFWWQVGN